MKLQWRFTTTIGWGDKDKVLFKMGHSRTLFRYFHLFNWQLAVNKYEFADNWIRTTDLWHRKWLLWQLSQNHKLSMALPSPLAKLPFSGHEIDSKLNCNQNWISSKKKIYDRYPVFCFESKSAILWTRSNTQKLTTTSTTRCSKSGRKYFVK